MEQTVNPESDSKRIFLRLDMDIAGPLMDRVEKHYTYQFHYRRLFSNPLALRQFGFLAGFGFRLSMAWRPDCFFEGALGAVVLIQRLREPGFGGDGRLNVIETRLHAQFIYRKDI